MVNEREMMLPENPKCPMGFQHLGSSPFCEGSVQTALLTPTHTSTTTHLLTTSNISTTLAPNELKICTCAILMTDKSDRDYVISQCSPLHPRKLNHSSDVKYFFVGCKKL
jgi:hypothetical protein